MSPPFEFSTELGVRLTELLRMRAKIMINDFNNRPLAPVNEGKRIAEPMAPTL